MINILQVPGSLRIGGLEAVAMNIARYSDKSKFHIDFVVYGDEHGDYEDEAINLGCNVFHLPYPHQNPFGFVSKIRKLMRDNGPYDIVHAHTLFNCGLVNMAAKKEGVKVRISHAHTNRIGRAKSLWRRCYEKLMRYYITRYTNVYYGCSVKAGNYLFGDRFDKEGHVLINGIDLDKFAIPTDIQAAYKRALSIDGLKVIGQVGTFNPVKNHAFSIQIMKEIVKKREDVRLLFVGKGPLFETIKQQVEDNGMSKYISMLGPRNDVPTILSILDVYLMPSKYEGVSVALMEAQAAGLPCVVTDAACAPEVHVTDQITTLKYEDSAESWAEAIIDNMEKVHNQRSSFNAIRDAGYDIREIVGHLNKDYESLVNRFKR